MKIIEAGHIYELNSIDGGEPVRLTFVNREPGTEHPGTQTQEALRSLIDRTMHCDNCLRWPGNDLIIYHLRMALVLHEARALERKVEKGYIRPELMSTSGEDGHFTLDDKVLVSVDNATYTQKAKRDSPLVKKMPNFCQS